MDRPTCVTSGKNRRHCRWCANSSDEGCSYRDFNAYCLDLFLSCHMLPATFQITIRSTLSLPIGTQELPPPRSPSALWLLLQSPEEKAIQAGTTIQDVLDHRAIGDIVEEFKERSDQYVDVSGFCMANNGDFTVIKKILENLQVQHQGCPQLVSRSLLRRSSSHRDFRRNLGSC